MNSYIWESGAATILLIVTGVIISCYWYNFIQECGRTKKRNRLIKDEILKSCYTQKLEIIEVSQVKYSMSILMKEHVDVTVSFDGQLFSMLIEKDKISGTIKMSAFNTIDNGKDGKRCFEGMNNQDEYFSPQIMAIAHYVIQYIIENDIFEPSPEEVLRKNLQRLKDSTKEDPIPPGAISLTRRMEAPEGLLDQESNDA